jgi:hypothetical protein
MSKKYLFTVSLMLASVFFTACSDDDKETARVAAASAAITHNASECPKVSGVYKRKEGFTKGVLGFSVTDGGTRLQLASESTGLDGHTFILDGKNHEETENGKALKYVAGCQNKTLRVVGSIDNGVDRIDMTISEKAGGTVSVKSGDAEGDYEQVVGQ